MSTASPKLPPAHRRQLSTSNHRRTPSQVHRPASSHQTNLPSHVEVASMITPLEYQQFNEMFKLVDRDSSGSITKAEFAALFRTLKLQVTPADLDAMIVDMDKNDDGEIQLNEFIACMSTRVATRYTADQVKAAFAAFASPWDNKHGRIDLSVIEMALNQPSMRMDGESLTEFEERRRIAIELLDQLQVDYMGKFHYEAYVNQVMK